MSAPPTDTDSAGTPAGKGNGWSDGPRVSAKRSAFVLALGNCATFMLTFLRSVLLARLLTVSDFGIVGTFMAALNLLQMSTQFNFQLLLAQHERGDDRHFAAAIKGLGVARGLLLAALMVAFSEPLARLMGQPGLGWAYACMAVIPFVSAFQHNDMFRFHRRMSFGPQAATGIATGLLTLALVWPLTLWLEDWRVALVLYAVQAVIGLVASHVVAERPFEIRWDWKIAGLGLRFGLPLVFSGIILFGALQGDRIIVANFYGSHELGLIAAALTMIMPPTLLAANMVKTYFLPILARHQNDQRNFDDRASFTLQVTLVGALVGSLAFAVLGPVVLVLAFGQKFAEAGAYAGFLGAAFSLQFARSGSSIVAIARQHTTNMLVANLLRLVFLIPAVAMAARGADIVSVLAVGFSGQFCAFFGSITMLYARTGLRNWSRMATPYACASACLTCLSISLWQPEHGYASVDVALFLAVGFCIATLLSCRSIYQNLRVQFRSGR